MEDLCICKICKKVFTDAQGLNKHKMAQHPPQKQHQQTQQSIYQAQNNNNNNNVNRDIAHLRNSNLSITRVHKETNNTVIVSQSTMNQNQNSFRKATVPPPSITVRRAEMKMMKQAEGARVRPPYRSPDAKSKQAASSIKSMVMGTAVEVDDDTTDWQKWEPGSKDRDNGSNHVAASSVPTRTSGGAIISKSAAEAASSAINQAHLSSTTARKSVPPLLRMVPGAQGNGGGGKRPAAGVKVSSTPQRIPPGGGGGGVRAPVADIMQNLGKMKSLASNRPSAPNQKLISLNPAKKSSNSPAAPYIPPKAAQPKQPVHQPFRVSKPPQVSKNKTKIVPRNAFNNALPKPGVGSSGQVPTEEMEVDSSDQQEEEDDRQEEEELIEEEEPELFMQLPAKQQGKKSVPPTKPKANAGGAGGKAPPPKSLNANRFNPIESPKKGKGKAAAPSSTTTTTTTTASPKGSPNGKPKAGGQAAANGTNNKQSSSSSSAAAVVGKKSAPPPAKKKKKGSEDPSKKLKTYVPTMPGTDYDMPKLSAIGSYTNRSGQQVWVCLVCNEKEHEESSRDMICCEMCEDWYHWECVGIRQAMKEEDPWYCKRCIYQASSNPKKDFPKIFKNDVLDF